MSDVVAEIGGSLKDRSRAAWISEVENSIALGGSVARLGERHFAVFRPGGATLLVAFETLQGVQTLSPRAEPMGWQAFEKNGWSSLSLISDGDTWFRNPDVFVYFDRLADRGFFDGFERVVFYGANACGYAAAAFSVTAPDARVLAVQPQATLDPKLTEWDRRFPDQRRVNFSDRYGYAPDMIEAARSAFVVYDPHQSEDAMHAALFLRQNVTPLKMRHMGAGLQTDLMQMRVLHQMIEDCAIDRLTPQRFASLIRARRDHLPYLRRLLAHLDGDDRAYLAHMMCHNVSARMRAPQFAQRLHSLPVSST